MSKEIKKIRSMIDEIDRQLLKKLAERFSLVEKIGKVKKIEGKKTEDKEREKEMENSRKQFAGELGLNQKLVKKLFKLIVDEAKKIQV